MNAQLRSRRWIAAASLALLISAWACGGAGGGTAIPTPPPLPTTAPPPTQGVVATPPEGIGGGGSGELAVINTAFHPRADGGWRLVGEVANNTAAPVSSLSLRLEWFDAAGASLGSDAGYALVTNLAPGETAPFIYNIYDSGLQLNSFTATIGEFTSSQELSRAQLDVEHAVLTVDDFGDFHCTGELVNNGSAPATIAGLAAAILDGNGVMVTADTYWAAARYLAPAERSPFRITPLGFSGAAAAGYSCRIFIDAVIAEAIPPSPLAFVDADGDGNLDTHYFVDSFGGGHLVGEVVNNGSEPLSVQLVAGLYDGGGNVIDADFASLPVPLDPGQALPFDFTSLSATNFNETLAGQAARFTVQVDPYWTFPVFTRQVELKPQNGVAANDNGTITETVEVLNDQSFAVDYAFVIARVADSSGRVVGYGYTSTTPVAAGEIVGVSVVIYVDPALDPASLTVSVLAVAPLP